MHHQHSQNNKDVEQAIANIKFKGGNTFTHLGLDFVMNTMLTPEHGARKDVAKLVVVITDGRSVNTKKTVMEANKLKATGRLM